MRLLAVSIDLALPQAVKTAEELGAFVQRRELALTVLAFQGDYDALAERLDLPGGPPCTVLFGPQGELGRLEGSAEGSEVEALIAAARAR